jgi:hypothetical protein
MLPTVAQGALIQNGGFNPAAIDALRRFGNDNRRSLRGGRRRSEARDRRQQRAIANHVQGAVAVELASLFPETVVNANASSSSDSQFRHLPSPRDVPLIFRYRCEHYDDATYTLPPHRPAHDDRSSHGQRRQHASHRCRRSNVSRCRPRHYAPIARSAWTTRWPYRRRPSRQTA